MFNPKLLKPSSFTLIQTKSLKDTLTRSSVHRNQSLYNRSHRIYIYIYSILLVVKEFKKEEKNLKIVVKKSISNLPSYLSVIVSNPHKYKQKNEHTFQAYQNLLFHNFLTVVCPKQKWEIFISLTKKESKAILSLIKIRNF